MEEKNIFLGNVQGNFEDKNFKIEIHPHAKDCKIYCDGKLLDYVSYLAIRIVGGRSTKIDVSYLCLE